MGGINCETFEDKLMDYEDGLLSAEESAGIEEHLRSCGACQKYKEQWDRSWELLDKAYPESAEIEPAPDFRSKFWRNVGREESKAEVIDLTSRLNSAARRMRIFKTGGLAMAASFVLISCAILWFVSGASQTASVTSASSSVAAAGASAKENVPKEFVQNYNALSRPAATASYVMYDGNSAVSVNTGERNNLGRNQAHGAADEGDNFMSGDQYWFTEDDINDSLENVI